jgi:3-methyl-2-oxobutanoate hydroxymethyltransferase
MSSLAKKFTLADLRSARVEGTKIPMLTCYDYTTAGLMQQAGVPTLLVGDSAANVILGYPTTLPVPLSFMVEIAAAVRRGAPYAFVIADMPFGTYAGSLGTSVRNVCRMAKQSNCDCVKMEVTARHSRLVQAVADAGVAVMAHLGLRPQSVAALGGYKVQGRTAMQAREIVETARTMERAGAVALLLEAVPDEVSRAVVQATNLPVIGCGAGPSCHGFVVVTHDSVALSDRKPKFVPNIGDLAAPAIDCFRRYVEQVVQGTYPAAEHGYDMPQSEREAFQKSLVVEG